MAATHINLSCFCRESDQADRQGSWASCLLCQELLISKTISKHFGTYFRCECAIALGATITMKLAVHRDVSL